MAGESEIEDLLLGISMGNPWIAFGISGSLSRCQLHRVCRQKMALFHQDRNNPVEISQMANIAAEVLCGRATRISSRTMEEASKLLNDICRRRSNAHQQQKEEERKRKHLERVVSAEHIKRGEALIGSFEHVKRKEASTHADIRAVFRKCFQLNVNEAGWLMKELGIKSVVNSQKKNVASLGPRGLKIRTTKGNCIECPFCTNYIPLPEPTEATEPEK